MAGRRDRSERIIADAWRDAKASDPSLTQSRFAAEAFPPYVERGGKRRYRSVETRARDLRRILSGKDTRARVRPLRQQAADFVKVARRQRGANVEIRNASGAIVGYGNVMLPPGTSSFDLYRLRDSPEGRRLARQIARKVRRGSPPHDVITIIDPVTGRKILSRRISPDAGSPAGEQHIGAIRQLRDPDKARYVGRFGPNES